MKFLVWKIKYQNKARRWLEKNAKSDKTITEGIIDRISELSENPYQMSKQLTGSTSFTLRIGDYRVIFDILYNEGVIDITKIFKRSKVY